ncbi:apolipoprotein N-acyltransferase [Aurantivibrio infirmus]
MSSAASQKQIHLSRITQSPLGYLVSLAAGALVPLSFAPYNIWPAAILGIAVLCALIQNQNAKRCFFLASMFGFGMFGFGISWVFVSINVYGNLGGLLAVVATFLFIWLVTTAFALPFSIYGLFLRQHHLGLLLGIPALWVLSEWIRTWLFTGFPWLFLGYGHLQTPLSGWAPITGVLGLSFATVLSAALLVYYWQVRQNYKLFSFAALLIASLWAIGFVLQTVQWTKTYREPVSVGLAQGNIPQEKKWALSFRQETLSRYYGMTQQLWGHDWIIWPEAAIPMLYNDPAAKPVIESLQVEAAKNNAGLITGILYDSPILSQAANELVVFNSIIGLGAGSGSYYKQRLVPFGEYRPLEKWTGKIFDLFNMPESITKGSSEQRGIQIKDAMLAPSICYEIVYPDLVARGARDAHALITISNDAWFGSSIGPLQHMEIAQMRALETRRYLIRSTNNGVSALVDDKGNILKKTEQFVMQTLSGEIELRQGMTPFMRFGSEPIVFLCLVIVGFIGWRGRPARN